MIWYFELTKFGIKTLREREERKKETKKERREREVME